MKKTVPTIGMIACFIVAKFFGYKAWNLHVEYQKADHEYQKIKKMKKKKTKKNKIKLGKIKKKIWNTNSMFLGKTRIIIK